MSDHAHKTQGYVFLLVFLMVSLCLSACGKKPGSVDPPLGVGKEEFPATYPDPATDPQPQ